jgi:soluble lytic murein transglycosylase-like protein
MGKWFVLLIAATCSSASAQEATLHSFSSEVPQSFHQLVPDASADRQPLAEVQASEPERALRQYLQDDADRPWLDDDAAMPSVPTWMRAGRPTSTPFKALTFSTGTDCGGTQYFPRIGISPDAQARRRVYFDLIAQVACEVGVPVRLFDALIAQESRYRPYARSSAGAMGLAQLMPGTAAYLGVSDPWHPEQNLRGGARYLREQLTRFGSWELALAAYNAGPGRIEQYNGIPPFRETRNYVRTIMASLDGGAPAPVPNSNKNPFRSVSISPFKLASNVPEY